MILCFAGCLLVVGVDWPAAMGAPVPGDVAALLTGTPADILILDAAVGVLAQGDTRALAAWRCGPTVDCAGVEADRLTVTGLGTHIVRGHRIYESTNAYAIAPADGAETGRIDYWMAPPPRGCSAAGRCVSKTTACLPGEGSGRCPLKRDLPPAYAAFSPTWSSTKRR